MVSPTLPGCPHHVSMNETSMLIRAFLKSDVMQDYMRQIGRAHV